MKKFKSKPRAPAYVQEVYQRIEVEMCTARNAVVALDLRIAPIIAKLSPEDQAEIEAALVAYNQRVCSAISKAGGLLAALDPRDVETLPKVWEPLDDPQTSKAPLHNAPNSDKMPPLDTPPGEGVFYEIIVKTFRQNAFFSWKKE